MDLNELTGVKVSDLPEATEVDSADVVPVLDISENILKQATLAQVSPQYSTMTAQQLISGSSTVSQNVRADALKEGIISIDQSSAINTNLNTVTFGQASTRQDLVSGDSHGVLFGKIKKFFADLKNVAFSGSYADLTDKPAINNGRLTIQKNGTTVNTFTANSGSNITANITVPTKVSDLSNDSNFITSTVNNLTNYYTKTQTYTKDEVNSLISSASTLDIQVVSQLPTSNISTSTIYLLSKSSSGSQNYYDEYINTTGTTQGWEKIGDTEVDLSNYYTKSETDSAINTSVTSKINALDVTGDSGIAASKTIASWSETNGKVSLTTQDISITKSQVSDFPTIPTVNNATLTIKQNGTSVGTFTANASSNKSVDITVPTETTVSDWGYTKNTGTVTRLDIGSVQYDPVDGVITIPDYPTSTDNKVAQNNTPGTTAVNSDYRVLFSQNANDTTQTTGARKNANLTYNPYTGNLKTTQLNGVNVGSTPKFTDESVTSSANHYSPVAQASAEISVDAASDTSATWGTTALVTGVEVQRDDKGHVTGLSLDSIKLPSNPNTDTKVRQTLVSDNVNRPILMANANNASTVVNVDNVANRSNNVYINPSTGNLQATQLNGVTIGSSPKFTDQQCSSISYHFSPTEDASETLSADASSSTSATWGTTSLVTGVDIKRDAVGHVTGVAVDSIKLPSNPNSDTKVTQTATTNNTTYEVLFSASASTATLTESARKSDKLGFNPSTGNLKTTQINGVTVGSTPKFTDQNVYQEDTYRMGYLDDAYYDVLLSSSQSGSGSETSSVQRYRFIKYNPGFNNLVVGKVNGTSPHNLWAPGGYGLDMDSTYPGDVPTYNFKLNLMGGGSGDQTYVPLNYTRLGVVNNREWRISWGNGAIPGTSSVPSHGTGTFPIAKIAESAEVASSSDFRVFEAEVWGLIDVASPYWMRMDVDSVYFTNDGTYWNAYVGFTNNRGAAVTDFNAKLIVSIPNPRT